MGLFKFQNYSAIKNAQDNPRVVATVETVNGNVFGIADVAGVERQLPFALAADAQGDVFVMLNVVDKPEVRNYADYSVLPREFIRAVKLNDLAGELVELSGDLVINGGGLPPAVGVALVPTVAADAPDIMIWKTIANPANYTAYLEITALTTFGMFTIDNAGVGYTAKIKSA